MHRPSTTIHEACRAGDFDMVRHFVSADPSLVDAEDVYEWRPIFHAALCRHLDVVRFLIEAGADLAADRGYVLHYAAEVPDNQEVVTLLVQYGALDAHVRPPDDLSRQFLAAIFLADHARVRSLLRRHPQLASLQDGRGDLPIHHAARNGDTEAVRALVEHGADVNSISQRGHTVLYCAGGHGHAETVEFLLEHGAEIEARCTKDGKTLLDWLAQFPHDSRFVGVIAAIIAYKDGDEPGQIR